MEIYFNSMYTDNTLADLNEYVKKYTAENIVLVLDTNICIYLRDFYNRPMEIVNRQDIWPKVRQLLKDIEILDLEVDYSLGIEEACRNLKDFSLDRDKLTEMYQCINSLFELDYIQMLQHSQLIKVNELKKDTTKREMTKIEALTQPSQFKNLVSNTYASVLKLYLLENFDVESTQLEKMKKYLDFISEEIDIIGIAEVVFASHYLSGNSAIASLIHKESKKKPERVIHALWNASIDLTMPALVGVKGMKDNKLTIFVTADGAINEIINGMYIKTVISDKLNDKYLPLIEVNFESSNWSNDDNFIIQEYYKVIQEKRMSRIIKSNINITEHLNKVKDICEILEKELIDKLDKI